MLKFRAISSMVERFVYTEAVNGSIPLLPKLNVLLLMIKVFIFNNTFYFFFNQLYIFKILFKFFKNRNDYILKIYVYFYIFF